MNGTLMGLISFIFFQVKIGNSVGTNTKNAKDKELFWSPILQNSDRISVLDRFFIIDSLDELENSISSE